MGVMAKNGELKSISIFKLLFIGPIVTGYLLRRLPKFKKIVVLIATLFPYFLSVGIEI